MRPLVCVNAMPRIKATLVNIGSVHMASRGWLIPLQTTKELSPEWSAATWEAAISPLGSVCVGQGMREERARERVVRVSIS